MIHVCHLYNINIACACDGQDIIGCTKRYCPEDEYEEARCLDCESNTEWSDCGGVCNPTCHNDFGDLLCGIRFIQEPGCGEPRCQCPIESPYWDGFECISERECQLQHTPSPIWITPSPSTPSPSTPAPVIIQGGKCPEMCNIFDDGCELCQCDQDGFSINCKATSTIGGCLPGFRDNSRCNECHDPDTMEYTNCGGCTQTCQNVVDGTFTLCPDLCVNKCQCKEETPFYLQSQGM